MTQAVDFETFLQSSYNRYAAALMVLAAAAEPARADGWALGASDSYSLHPGVPAWLRRAPTLTYFDAARSSDASGLHRLRRMIGNPQSWHNQWAVRLGTMFDIPLVATEPDQQALGHDIWWGLAGRDERNPAHCSAPALRRPGKMPDWAFCSISPEPESFQVDKTFDQNRDVWKSYISLIIGNGTSKWSTVRLAEAYARVVTGRRVRATLLAGMPGSAPADLDELNPYVRWRLLRGMERVVTAGTAAALQETVRQLSSRLPPGERLHIFAKTGTPSLQQNEPNILNSEANALIDLGALVPCGTRLGIRGRNCAEAIEVGLQRNIVARERLGRSGVPAQRVAAEIRLINSGRGGALVWAGPDRVTGVESDDGGGTAHEGSVLALVVGRYPAGDCELQSRRASRCLPIRALAIAINMQERNGGVNAAIPLAKAQLAIDGPLARWLLAGVK